MILSIAYRFVFIKTLKTAGTAIEVSLSDLCAESDILTPIEPALSPHRPRNYERFRFYNHMPAQQMTTRIAPETWATIHKVTAERNPWDKVVSFYFWQCRAWGVVDPFPVFVRKSANGRAHPYLLPPAWELYAIDGQSCVDRFIRYECLASDLDKFCREIFGQPLPKLYEAKTGIRPPGTKYRDLYDEESRKIVECTYAREIELLGYNF